MSLDLKGIKLIIWDLDGTFWDGILTEGGISPVETNSRLLKDLSERGIINSICSKNDFELCKTELEKIGVWDYFVFPSINWEPKGKRIKSNIEDMGLRPVNVLFIDDNISNLKEAQHFCPDINVCLNTEISEIISQCDAIDVTDKSLKRLKQYRILESKSKAKESSISNEEFLFSSNVCVEVKRDCLNELDRIHELIMRTNRLNFTKKRISVEELKKIISDGSYDCGYVNVSDKYGDYGIVGFFAVKNNRAEHFVFSCRTLGMGIEQWVYSEIGFPDVDISGEISGELKKDYVPEWINNTAKSKHRMSASDNSTQKILFKGPCDLSGILTYISNQSFIDTEFAAVNEKTGVFVKSTNHTMHILQSQTLSEEAKKKIIGELPFSSDDFYDTKMFDGGYDIVFYSTFADPYLGLYQRKKTGEIAAYGDWCYDLTDDENRQGYKDGSINNSNCNFTDKQLDFIKENYTYCGRIDIEKTVKNLVIIRELMNENTLLVLMLGSEKEFVGDTEKVYEGRHLYNKELNLKIKEAFKDTDNVQFVEFDKIVKSNEDYLDSLTHFKKVVYYEAAQKVIDIINEHSGLLIKRQSKLFLFATQILQKTQKNKILYKIMLKLRSLIKGVIK